MKEPKDKRTKEWKMWKKGQDLVSKETPLRILNDKILSDLDDEILGESKGLDDKWHNYINPKNLSAFTKEYTEEEKKFHKEFTEPHQNNSKGLGDTIEKITKATGIKKAVELFSKATGIDCGCDERKEKLNKIFSYSTKVNCLTEEQYNKWKDYKATKSNTLNVEERELVAELHATVFNHKYHEPCTCTPKVWIGWIRELDKVYSTYEV